MERCKTRGLKGYFCREERSCSAEKEITEAKTKQKLPDEEEIMRNCEGCLLLPEVLSQLKKYKDKPAPN